MIWFTVRSAVAALTIAFLLLPGLSGSAAFAQAYPSKPIKLIVGFAPGGSTDIVARLVAQHLSPGLGQPVIVENRPGAAGTIGLEAAAKSTNDGYTLALGTTGTLAAAPNLYPSVGYDPVKSFAPISLVTNNAFLVVVHSAVPANSLQELIDLAKSKPGQLNFGSSGSGTPPHIAGELFKTAAGVDLLHVSYKSMGPAVSDLLAGRIQIVFDLPAALLPHIRTGKIRALAVAAPSRLPQVPSVPTAAESGLAGYEVSAWFGLVAPAGTPNAVIRRLNEEVSKVLATKELRDAFFAQGIEPTSSSGEQFSALIVSETAKWARAIKASGAKLD